MGSRNSNNRNNAGPSQRCLRVSETIRSALANIFLQEGFYGSVLQGMSITVSEVRISPDLKNALVFVLPLGGKIPEGFLAAMEAMTPHFRHMLAGKIDLRVVPRLQFKIDESFEYANKINTLLSNIDK